MRKTILLLGSGELGKEFVIAAQRAWAERIALRRGRKVAVVALARRLAGILYAMMRDRTNYTPVPPHRLPVTRTAVAAA